MARPKGGTRKLVWIMAVLVVLSSGATAAAFYLLLNDGDDANQASIQPAPEREAPIFVNVEPFTVNLADDDYGSRLLYTGMSFKVADQETHEILVEHMPQVRSRLLTLLSGQLASDLTGPEGKQQLAREVVAALEPPMVEHQPELAIQEVLFTEFIVQ